MSLQQAQNDAVESLLISLLKNRQFNMIAFKVFEDAHAKIMSEDGPPGATEKSEAAEYLKHLKAMI
ncbi:hypothetical protein CBI55_03635 [Pseudomonas syringae]|uniref:hypothetical protein n=1 Tax=Pseudomonas TaxID=286 RepID=UPI000C1C9F11|nr:hypothetical protein [Pseudomonas syringae]MCH5508871.1 hypothetical protein [Pseudomonas syringae pv. syringae]MCH5637626.1 hypothetical protein [Pseudomonas syringae pv. syringae]MCH7426759.1 hypothetical protein [Pseudomonas syringae pv. syringae]PIO96028.1 hypothetical protein CBI55_03635 [Pseudomonas syringae]RXT88602.1 hypothetical protein B1F69_19360 [Pseudomonas syringae]